MADDSDLFVVCRSCGAEVSRYVTECPYCGERVQRRAPKLPRSRPKGPSSQRRRVRLPGGETTGPPFVAIALAVACAVGTVILVPGAVTPGDAGIVGPVDGQWWRAAVSPFLAPNVWYGGLGVLAIAVFGGMIERRHGHVITAVIFLVCGIGGAAAAGALETIPYALGANGAALGFIGAWMMAEAVRVGYGEREWPELIPAGVCAAVMLLIDRKSVV